LPLQEQIERAIAAPVLGAASLCGNRQPSTTARRITQYFEESGFSRWAAIYGDGVIPPIWRVIREGHDTALDQVVEWIQDDEPRTALDAGCGTGMLTTRLAGRGYAVDALDISTPMVSFARYRSRGIRGPEPRFHVGDIASLEASPRAYDLVCCLDVLFHYPYDEVVPMLTKLAELSERKLIGSFALRTSLNALWMYVGEKYFHKKNRMTHLYLLSYDQVERILYRAGFRLTRWRRVKKFFYDSFMFEAVRR
jgi:magnesium-protoporphyrin O-methyltransferase